MLTALKGKIYPNQEQQIALAKNLDFPSKKLCNCCKYKNNLLSLRDREWTCPNCGNHHERDKNAAKTIREEGMRILSINTAEHAEIQACREGVRLTSESRNTGARKRRLMKQESPTKLRCGGESVKRQSKESRME